MNLTLLLEMAASGFDDRIAFGTRDGGVTYSELAARATTGAAALRAAGVEHLVYVATNGPEFPVALFAAARAEVPLVPINYRLGPDQLHELLGAHPSSLVILEDEIRELAGNAGRVRVSPAEWLEMTDPANGGDPGPEPFDPDAIALLLYTSGTTAAPKAAVLRHRHLTSYVMTTVEFASADPDAASLVSVPPYHIAGVSNTISNLYAGRRVVHLTTFTPRPGSTPCGVRRSPTRSSYRRCSPAWSSTSTRSGSPTRRCRPCSRSRTAARPCRPASSSARSPCSPPPTS